MMYVVKLKIADIIIQLKSQFKMEPLDKKVSQQFAHFIYRGFKRPQINLAVNVVNQLPKLSRLKRIFLAKCPQSNKTNWALFKNEKHYILRQYVSRKKQHTILNARFNQGSVYLLKDNQDGSLWKLTDITYHTLQVILISYLANRDGIFVHAVGIKDINQKGLLFVGKSGQGKTATARLWHQHSQAKILNDDRIIIRKKGSNFYLYTNPWHGGFRDYLLSRIDKGKLARLFFIYPAQENSTQPLLKNSASRLFYPTLFPPFWDKAGLEKTIGFSQELVSNVPCFRLGFKNTKEVIGFVRRIK